MEAKQELFDFFAQEHGLTLLDSQMNDVIHKVFSLFAKCQCCGGIIHTADAVMCEPCELKANKLFNLQS